MPNGVKQLEVQIKNDFFCYPLCKKPLNILETVVFKKEPLGDVSECRELTYMTLVHFHIQYLNVIAPSRLIQNEKGILNDE